MDNYLNVTPVVAVNKCDNYNVDEIKEILKNQFKRIGVTKELLKDKKIAIKPNLVAPMKPEDSVTTHPAIVEAVYLLLLLMTC